MINSHDIANLCGALYCEPSQFDRVINVANVCVGVKRYQEATCYIFRGSYTMLDWIRDLASLYVVASQDIGWVPFGFDIGMDEIFKVLDPMKEERPIIIGGHSLGAAHAAHLCGKLVAGNGREATNKIALMTLFGCPTPGAERLRWLCSGVKIESFKNRSDRVTAVPLLPSLVPVREFTRLNITPADPHPWGLFADHHIQNYILGTHSLTGEAK